MDSIHARFSSIRSRMPHGVRLVAVTKGRTPREIQSVIEAGAKEIGESKVAEAAEKFKKTPIPARTIKHLVGHLQRNKVKEAVAIFDVIQSVDSLPLARKIAAEATAQKKPLLIYVEYNVTGLPNRSGFKDEKELAAALVGIRALQNEYFKLDGLMGIARPLESADLDDDEAGSEGEDERGSGEGDGKDAAASSDPEEDPAIVRAVLEDFRSLRNVAKANGLRVLSMGMSDDYELALDMGSTMVRLGRAIFGDDAD